MFNRTSKTRVKLKWPGLLKRVCTIWGMADAVHPLCIALSACFLTVYLQTPAPPMASRWTSNRDFHFPTWEKSSNTIAKQFLLTLYFSLKHHPMDFSLLIISVSSVTKGFEPARGKTALFLSVFGVNEEEAEILQVETKDRKSTECICVA